MIKNAAALLFQVKTDKVSKHSIEDSQLTNNGKKVLVSEEQKEEQNPESLLMQESIHKIEEKLFSPTVRNDQHKTVDKEQDIQDKETNPGPLYKNQDNTDSCFGQP